MSQQHPANIVIKNLSPTATPETISEYLWLTLGLDVKSELITLGPPSPVSAMAFVRINRDCLAEFLRRYLEGQTMDGRSLVVEAAKPRGESSKKLWPPRGVTPRKS
jgi:hypothetical protein